MKKDIFWLRENFEKVFNLPESAIEYLLIIYNASQLIDDIIDGDKINNDDIYAVFWNLLIGINQNNFFELNSKQLVPLVATSFLKWKAANNAELKKEHDEKSFMWRAGYYDIVLIVINICKGAKYCIDNADIIMRLYGESYKNYKEEFDNV